MIATAYFYGRGDRQRRDLPDLIKNATGGDLGMAMEQAYQYLALVRVERTFAESAIEFLERRFSPRSRYLLTVVSLISFIVSKIAVGIFAGGVVFVPDRDEPRQAQYL